MVYGGEGEGSGVYLLQKPNPGIFYRIRIRPPPLFPNFTLSKVPPHPPEHELEPGNVMSALIFFSFTWLL